MISSCLLLILPFLIGKKIGLLFGRFFHHFFVGNQDAGLELLKQLN